jgi:hypothetical protein
MTNHFAISESILIIYCSLSREMSLTVLRQVILIHKYSEGHTRIIIAERAESYSSTPVYSVLWSYSEYSSRLHTYQY